MKYFFLLLFVIASLAGKTQTSTQVNRIGTEIDKSKKRWLDSLMEIIGDKRIVALGEDTHGTADFYELRDIITRRLVREKGFTILILENPHEDMMALQQGLKKEKLDTLMRRHLFSIYQTKQMKDFLSWFKKYSRKRKKLKLAGCDDSYRELLPEALVKEAARYKDTTLSQWSEEFLFRQTHDISEYYDHYPSGKPEKLPNEMQFGKGTFRLLERIDSLCKVRGFGHPALDELIFHAKTNYVYYDRFARKVNVSRDEIMGERINYYAADSSAKIIVWAHNGHIAKYAWLDGELGLMGATVLKQSPADYISIGMGSSEGSYSYMKARFINNDHVFNDSLFSASLHSPQANSWNEWLLSNVPGNYLLDFSRLSVPDREEWEQDRLLKILGYGKESDTGKDYYNVSLTRLFDVLLFMKRTEATTPL